MYNQSRYLVAGLFIVLFLLPNWVAEGVAWDDTTTHRDLSRRAAEHSNLDKGYLQILGLREGLDTPLQWDGAPREKVQDVRRWIQDGGEFEDASGRYFNHFHDPLEPWSFAGLADIWTGGSAVHWAQNWGTFSQPNTDWSWAAVRTKYHLALTSPTKSERDAFFAQTFRGLGHQIHLLQDMSQPAHVRNDAHPEDALGGYFNNRWIERLENWAKANRATALGFMNTVVPPTIPPEKFLQSAEPGLVPVTAFWDTDTFTLTSSAPPSGTDVGLAEYTNGNYFSDDTIDAAYQHYYRFPSTADSTYSRCAGDAPALSFGLKRHYLSRYGCQADDRPVDHFLAESFLGNPSQPDRRYYFLNDLVYRDYAQALLPRAVGYSAALIDYFFRGQLAVEKVDVNNIKIRNLSPDPLNAGTIALYYDNVADDRILLTTYTLSVPIGPGQTTDSIYVVSPTDNKTPGRYWAVFRGTLGGEEDAVIGSGGPYWAEEWDQGLTGRHPWYSTTTDPYWGNNPGGTGTSLVSNGNLRLELTRQPLTNAQGQLGHWYDQQTFSYIGPDLSRSLENDPQRDVFPIPVTPATELHVKVDEMSLNVQLPVPQCPSSTHATGARQLIRLHFLNVNFFLQVTVLGHQSSATDTTTPVLIEVGVDNRINLYQELQKRGVPFSEPLYIDQVALLQELYPMCEPNSDVQRQVMQVDYLRIVEGVGAP